MLLMRPAKVLWTLFAAASLSVSVPAFAQSDADKATARQLGQEAQDALDHGDFKTAEDKFSRADKLFHFPTLALGLARAYAGQKKYVQAQEAYNRIVREGVPPGAPPAVAKAVEDAKKEAEQIAPKIGGVTITVTPPDAPGLKVTFDDQPVNTAALGVRRASDPGSHVVKATADGYKPGTANVNVPEGGSANAAITLEKDTGTTPNPNPNPDPNPNPNPNPTPDKPITVDTKKGGSILPFVAFGVGGAGLLVGGITGFIAMGKKSDLDKACPNGTCPASAQSDLDSYHSMGLISTIGFVVAGVGAAAGVILLVTQPKNPPPTQATTKLQVTPYLGLGSVGAVGRF
jgi:hypothetical protein